MHHVVYFSKNWFFIGATNDSFPTLHLYHYGSLLNRYISINEHLLEIHDNDDTMSLEIIFVEYLFNTSTPQVSKTCIDIFHAMSSITNLLSTI